MLLNTDGLDREPLELDWSPAEDGWEWSGEVMLLTGSRDGELLCLGLCVGLPDSLMPAGADAPGPLMLVVCGPAGTDARPLALSVLVGGGPRFGFTTDSRYLYGSPILDCEPLPGEYRDLLAGSWPGSSDAHLIDVSDGSRLGRCAGILADGFLSNPHSDLVAAGAYPPDLILDAGSGEVLLEDSTGGGILYEWVLPDAGLAREGDRQVLRFADGRTRRNPDGEVRVHLRLDDGRYLFSRGGSHEVLLGTIDWSDFSSPDSGRLPALSEEMVDGVIVQSGDSDMILFVWEGNLWVYRCPRF
jgi:hypothetical protein